MVKVNSHFDKLNDRLQLDAEFIEASLENHFLCPVRKNFMVKVNGHFDKLNGRLQLDAEFIEALLREFFTKSFR